MSFLRYLASNNGVTLKSGVGVLQGCCKWRRSIDQAKPRETSVVLSLRTTTRKRSSATGYGGARWSSTTYYCGGSKSATGVAVYGKLVEMLENYRRLSLIYWSLRQLPLITFQPNSSQLYSRTRWTPFGQVWWAAAPR